MKTLETSATTKFSDRREAGKLLAQKLLKYRNADVVYALPRGGIETAVEVARKLKLPLRLVVARKIGHPRNPEFAVGAVTNTGPAIWDEAETSYLSEWWCERAEHKARKEVKRQDEIYDIGQKRLKLEGKSAILVDDGIATGLTMQAAISELRINKPSEVIVAAPVISKESVIGLEESADKVISLIDPSLFGDAVSQHYDTFPQLSDDNVLDLLDEAKQLG